MTANPSSMEQPAGAVRMGAASAGARPGPTGATEKRRYGVPNDERVGSVDGGRAATAVPPEEPPSVTRVTMRQRLRTTLELLRGNPTGRITLKVAVSIAGAVVVALGLALIPLPGPGWLIVIGGLGIWAVEFHWARRLLNFTRRNVQAWARWVRRQSLLMRIAIGSVGLVFVAVVVWLSLRLSLGIDVLARVMHYIATH